jgi:rubrerythrin
MDREKLNELIDFAMEQEQAAVDFYVELAGKVTEQHVRETLLGFAEQEREHKARLQALREKGTVRLGRREARDLKIGDYLVDVEPSPELSFQGALVIAMKKEKAAYRLYMDLAAQCDDDESQKVFLFLAQQEANHKLAFETQYDDLIYQEN